MKFADHFQMHGMANCSEALAVSLAPSNKRVIITAKCKAGNMKFKPSLQSAEPLLEQCGSENDLKVQCAIISPKTHSDALVKKCYF